MTGKVQNNGSIRLPWQLAWLLGGTLITVGAMWGRAEVNAVRVTEKIESQTALYIDIQARVALMEARNTRAGFTREDADTLRTEMLKEIRRSRGWTDQRIDELEARLEAMKWTR